MNDIDITSDILNIIKIGILKIDCNCNFMYSNKYLLDFFNIKIVSDLYSLIHPDDFQSQMELCSSLIKNQTESDSICRIKIVEDFKWIKIKK